MHPPDEDESFAIRRFERKLFEVKRKLQRAAEMNESALDGVSSMEKAIQERAAGQSPRRERRRARLAGPLPSAQNFFVARSESGAADVSFDGGTKIHLPRALAELIAILASNRDAAADEFVAWTGIDALGQKLELALGRRFARQNIRQLLYRLRRALSDAGEDPRLIESSNRQGTRLRLKRRTDGLCTGAEPGWQARL